MSMKRIISFALWTALCSIQPLRIKRSILIKVSQLKPGGDIWHYLGRVSAICVTTNGVIKRDGRLVMGAGIAKQARDRFPDIDLTAGQKVKTFGNVPAILHQEGATSIVSLPTKNHFQHKSDMSLIVRSCILLQKMADEQGWRYIALTPPGCGHGGLRWLDVKSEIQNILDDRFYVLLRKG